MKGILVDPDVLTPWNILHLICYLLVLVLLAAKLCKILGGKGFNSEGDGVKIVVNIIRYLQIFFRGWYLCI